MPSTLLELLKALNGLSSTKIEIRYPSAYFYLDLGLVIYAKQIIDIKMGVESRRKNYILSVCNSDVFENYIKYFLDHMEQTENEDTAIFDALRMFLEESEGEEPAL